MNQVSFKRFLFGCLAAAAVLLLPAVSHAQMGECSGGLCGTPNQSGGVPVNIAGDPACAYALKLRYSTRHYPTGEGGDEVLYCIE